MKTHCWVRASDSDFTGPLPQPRSGHTAVNIGKSKIVFFGGLVDKKFLNDVTVYDIDNDMWFQPECTGTGSDGNVGPSPRAFHIAVSIDCHMFIFGGRSGGKRLGDFWVLDTDIWQWSELATFGDLPSSRDFAAASAVGYSKIVMYGGWDGKKWLSDVFVLDTISLEWMELSVSGTIPPPRCGHSVTMIEKRLLIFGGRGGGGPIMGDLWAFKGLIKEENEPPGWTQLKLPGQAPLPRCGHTMASGGPNLLLFGGHGTGGWLSRYDIYYNDCVVLDRVTVQWKRLPTSNDPPAARAYHSMNCVGSRYLLFGGFDGKSTYGDLWWLVPEDDPIAKRSSISSSEVVPERDTSTGEKGGQREGDAITELQKRLEMSGVLSNSLHIVDEMEDKELIQQALRVSGKEAVNNMQAVQAVREHWMRSTPESINLKEISPLLHDYQRLITRHHMDALRKLFGGEEWFNSNLAKTVAGGKVHDVVLSTRFWSSVEDCIRASQPLLVVLRIVDGDEKPAMAEICASMEYAKAKIKCALEKKPRLSSKVLSIIEKRWESQMEVDLYSAALFLNPGRFFDIKEDDYAYSSRLRMKFNDVLERMVLDTSVVEKISDQADQYENSRNSFGKQLSIRQRKTKNPLDWWGAFGGNTIELAMFAKRVVGLCCSSSGCERNWSTFEFIHTKKRNRLEHQRLNDLVYVQYNRKIATRFQKRREDGKNFDPLLLDDFQWDNEWVNGEVVDPGDVDWLAVDRALEASEGIDGRRNPSRGGGGDVARITYSRRRGSGSSHIDASSDVEMELDPIILNDDEDVDDDYGHRPPPTTSTHETSDHDTHDLELDDYV